MMIQLQTQGFEETSEYLKKLEIEKQLERELDWILGAVLEFVKDATPVDTGAMRGAWQWARNGLQGRVELNPSAVNPRSGLSVMDYAVEVNERLGILDQVVHTEWPRLGFDIQI